MKSKTPTPENETKRLEALKRYRIVDTEAEEGFDRITRIAAAFFNTPIALVALVDETRQWFKSKQGLEVTETPREIAFCAHTICGTDTMVVPDTLYDSRFENSVLVQGDPNIRFYAGTPLRTSDGENLGTLCVIDTVPREFSEAEEKVLRDLSGLVIDQLELRLANIRAEEELARHTQNIELLRNNQTRLNAIFNSTYDGILVLDQNGRVESHNLAAEQLFGYNSSELIGLYGKTLMPDSFDSKVSDFFSSHQPTGFSKYFIGGDQNNFAVRKNGERFPVELSVSEMYLNSEYHYCLIGRDISEKKRTERKLIDAVLIAEKSNATQLELLASLSHEYLTPLNAIIGFSELLQEDIEKILSSKQRGHFQQIIEGARRLTTITTQMIEYSHRATSARQDKIEEFPVAPLIEECWNNLKWLATDKELQYLLTVDSSKVTDIKSNKENLKHVLTIILSNAIKYNKHKGRIDVSVTHSNDGFAIISISDTGVGINNQDIATIFELFNHSATKEFDYTNTELALCRAIVQGMKGDIYAESDEKDGTTFYLKIPMKTPLRSNIAAEDKTKEAQKPQLSKYLDNKNILLITNNITLIKNIEKILKPRQELSIDYAIHEALGLALAIKTSPDLIILDSKLAESELLKLLPKLRSHIKTAKIPVLVVGDIGSSITMRQFSELEKQDWIVANEIEAILESTVDRILHRH